MGATQSLPYKVKNTLAVENPHTSPVITLMNTLSVIEGRRQRGGPYQLSYVLATRNGRLATTLLDEGVTEKFISLKLASHMGLCLVKTDDCLNVVGHSLKGSVYRVDNVSL